MDHVQTDSCLALLCCRKYDSSKPREQRASCAVAPESLLSGIDLIVFCRDGIRALSPEASSSMLVGRHAAHPTLFSAQVGSTCSMSNAKDVMCLVSFRMLADFVSSTSLD